MKIMLLSFLSLSLIGMSDSRSVTMPNTPELRPNTFRFEHHQTSTTNDFIMIPVITVTPEDEATFHRSIKEAEERDSARRLEDIEAQQVVVPQAKKTIKQHIVDNKHLIWTNFTTATLTSIVTLIVHFTAAK